MRSFVKIKPLRNGEITLSFTDIGKFCHCHKFLTSQICLLNIFEKIVFVRKFPDLLYQQLFSILKITASKNFILM